MQEPLVSMLADKGRCRVCIWVGVGLGWHVSWSGETTRAGRSDLPSACGAACTWKQIFAEALPLATLGPRWTSLAFHFFTQSL